MNSFISYVHTSQTTTQERTFQMLTSLNYFYPNHYYWCCRSKRAISVSVLWKDLKLSGIDLHTLLIHRHFHSLCTSHYLKYSVDPEPQNPEVKTDFSWCTVTSLTLCNRTEPLEKQSKEQIHGRSKPRVPGALRCSPHFTKAPASKLRLLFASHRCTSSTFIRWDRSVLKTIRKNLFLNNVSPCAQEKYRAFFLIILKS